MPGCWVAHGGNVGPAHGLLDGGREAADGSGTTPEASEAADGSEEDAPSDIRPTNDSSSMCSMPSGIEQSNSISSDEAEETSE